MCVCSRIGRHYGQRLYSMLGAAENWLSEACSQELILHPFYFKMESTQNTNKKRGGVESQSVSIRNRREVQTDMEEDGASGILPCIGTTRNGNTTPAADVLPVDQPATTKAGLPRQRMTWTKEMNYHVMWCYYIVSNLETTSIDRVEFRKLFLEKFPNYTNVTEQRLADQWRVIVNNNRITLFEREDIKRNVSEYLRQQHDSDTLSRPPSPVTPNTSTQIPPALPPTQMQQTYNPSTSPSNQRKIRRSQTQGSLQQNILNNLSNTLRNTLEEQLATWRGTDPTKRFRLPKLRQSTFTKQNIQLLNTMLEEYKADILSIEEWQTLVYCAASTILILNHQEPRQQTHQAKIKKIPAWQKRIERKIVTFRQNIGRLTQRIKGNQSTRVIKLTDKLLVNNENPIEALDRFKQKLAVQTARLARYKESNLRRNQNTIFQSDQKRFYQTLQKSDIEPIDPPSKDQITEFWQRIWSHPVEHNKNALWIDKEQQRYADIPKHTDYYFTLCEITEIIKKTHNWKATGTDNIHNFWYKQFTNLHTTLVQFINHIIQHPEECPDFLTEGRTFIKPKNHITQDPANYRPITCLQTLYKIITAALTSKIDKYLTTHKILTEQQKGCRKSSRGCKEQLIIDSVLMNHLVKKQRNGRFTFIDYKKAFDSVPHSWLIKILEIYQIHPTIRKFLSHVMTQWKTSIQLNDIKTNEINIRRGIFQGDSLSALWFCMSLNPLSNMLNDTKYGISITQNQKLNHLLYMDDIKLYASTDHQLTTLNNLTAKFSEDIHMEFGVDKCKTLAINRGKWSDLNPTITLNDEILDTIQENETYKYLGFEQNTRMEHSEIRKLLKEKYQNRLNALCKSYLNSRNLFTAINTFAIPVLTYSFGIIHWSHTETEKLNRMTRTTLTKHRKLHPNSCTERLYLSRKEGGRGLSDITAINEKQINSLRNFFHSKQHPIHHAIVNIDNYTPLNLHSNERSEPSTTDIKKREQWAQKALHGRHPYHMKHADVDKELSYTWLKNGLLHPETEGTLLAIQDQVIATRNYKKFIIKDQNIQSDLCRKCHQFSETIDHITSGCKLLAATEYTERHNNAARIVHLELAKKYNLLTEETPYYKYNPESVLENETVKLYWDRSIQTDHTIVNNRPDITLIHKHTKSTFLIDIAIPSDNNIQKKYEEKITKYLPLSIEIKKIWNQEQVSIVPIIQSVTGITHRSLTNSLQVLDLPEYTHQSIQKAVILKTCNILRNFLQIN